MARRSKRANISEGLREIGACWAVTPQKCILPGDGYDAKPSYHIHPDCSDPHENSIIQFYTLDEIRRYIQARKTAATMPIDAAMDYMEEFWIALASED